MSELFSAILLLLYANGMRMINIYFHRRFDDNIAMRIFPAFIFGELNDLRTGKRDKSQQYSCVCRSIMQFDSLHSMVGGTLFDIFSYITAKLPNNVNSHFIRIIILSNLNPMFCIENKTEKSLT